VTSINTNQNAYVALRILGQATSEAEQARKRISTGLRIADAYDDGAAYANAMGNKAQVAGWAACREVVLKHKANLDSNIAPAQEIQARLVAVKEKLYGAKSQQLSPEQRRQYEIEIENRFDEINTLANGSKVSENLINRTGVTFQTDPVGNADPPLPPAQIGNLSNVQLRARITDDTVQDRSGDKSPTNGVINAGEGFELDFVFTNSSGQVARNVSFLDATFSPAVPLLNKNAAFGDVAPTGTVVTDTGTDLDPDFVNLANGTPVTITLTLEADGQRAQLTFDPMVVGAITHGQVFNVAGKTGVINDGGRPPQGGEVVGGTPSIVHATSNTVTFPYSPRPDFHTIEPKDMTTGGLGLDPWSFDHDLEVLIGKVDRAMEDAGIKTQYLASEAKSLENKLRTAATMEDFHHGALGATTDADLAKESAALQAAQVREQLASQELQQAGSATGWLLGLFRK
jgi:flagellin